MATEDDSGGYATAMVESFWPSMQIELMNFWKWPTRIFLDNETFEYIEILCNSQRRHSQLNYESPVAHELCYEPPSGPARSSDSAV